MSWLTQIVRFAGYGKALDTVEGVEKAVGIPYNGNAKPPQPVAVSPSSVPFFPSMTVQQSFAPVETVAIKDVAALIQASAHVLLGRYLGPGATIAEPIVTSLIQDFEASLVKAIAPNG